MNEKGVPQGLTGLATHLHFHEPANFVVIYFLQLGLFHNLCKPEKGTILIVALSYAYLSTFSPIAPQLKCIEIRHGLSKITQVRHFCSN